ncbi:Transcriptional regulator/antitoxin, MazE [uncultured spirochete]|jgi:antitoxin MazE|uniref:Transcriptional regulator/antitoxin, MazE n=1 Tax=uncultured spirochete TaxID=156406 RepID=A0A3P3XP81_9SPIR|nr:Transcriptional regulator/antitoxin, MazE [uncultured spirochete]
MKAIVQKWGNSLGIRIPAVYAKELDLKNGVFVDIVKDGGKIVILPPKPTLEGLLSEVTKDNMQDYIDSGSSVGKEAW